MLLYICTTFSTVFSINVIEMNTLIKGETVSWALPPGSWDTETTTDYTRSQQFPRQGQSFHKNGGVGGERSRAKEKLQLCAVESRLFWCQRPSKTKANEKNKDHGIWSHHFSANRWENNGHSDRLYFLVLQNHCGQ